MVREKTKERVLNSIIEYIKEHGYPPSAQDICEMTRLKSKASVHEYLRQLMMDGKIESDDEGKARAIKVSDYTYIKKDDEKNLTVEKVIRVSGSQCIWIEKDGTTLYHGMAENLCIISLLNSTVQNIVYRDNAAVLQIA